MRSWTENGARFYAIPTGGGGGASVTVMVTALPRHPRVPLSGGGAEAVVGALAIADESVYVRAT